MRYDKKKITSRFAELTALADSIWQETQRNDGIVNPTNVAKLRASARNLLTILLPGSKVYLDEWDGLNLEGQPRINAGWYKGILIAAHEDFLNGIIVDPTLLLRADIFVDFLQQAEYLLGEGFKDASAVIIGSVIEDSLRKLCDIHHIDYTSKNSINHLNQELYKNKIYNKLWFEEIGAKAVIRNDAAHGHYDQYIADDVQLMLSFTRKFLVEFLK